VVWSLPVGRRPLANQDEARFALLAREGVEHSHWLLPRVRGVIYLNKPPLYFWTVGLLALPFGAVTDATAPLASILCALAALLAIVALGRRLWSLGVGLTAGLVLATAPYFYFMSHQVPCDPLLTRRPASNSPAKSQVWGPVRVTTILSQPSLRRVCRT
jgi:4-amino-4-deoxy-L-arabinose transferase-like glycosyltransferase